MKSASFIRTSFAGVLLSILGCVGAAQAQDTITIGLNMPFSGGREAAGTSARAGAEMAREKINAAGGLEVGGKSYKIEYVVADNESNPQKAVNNTLKLVTQDRVLGIVGPNDSSNAIPAGGLCDSFKTPMVSGTSTNPKTTLNRPYVFRACFLDPFQGQVMASFSTSEFNATKAAVLYNISDAYPRGLAEFFKAAFEEKHGEGSVVAFEDFLSSEKDLSEHLDRIVASGADVLFVPQYDNEIPDIVKLARKRGWDKVIMGGDAWETSGLIENCGDACKDLFFSSHFAALGATGKTAEFVEAYQQEYKQRPTGDAALGYDAASILFLAIASLDSLSDNLLEARTAVKEKLGTVKNYQGVSGLIDMNVNGDPTKSATIIKINDNLEFESYQIGTP